MIRAVIADDSAFLRQVLTDVLDESGRIKVVGQAKNGKEAVALVKEHKPDVLILDVEMPVMTGLQALRQVMEEHPLPVFMFSSLTHEGASVTIKALEYGAVEFLPKPMGGAHSLDTVSDELIQKITCVARQKRFSAHGGAQPPRSAQSGAAPVTRRPGAAPRSISRRNISLIAMGSSTGGVQAAMKVVPKLPAATRPIVWVQHMPPNFTKSFADRLNSISQMKVKEAEDGERIEPGVCYLAEGGKQMRLKKRGASFFIQAGGSEKVTGHCPSCDVLFKSAADYFNSDLLGVILTGMGNDGTEGLVTLHSQGAFVIGQSEPTCVVYGMPRAACEAGAVDVELDIDKIAEGIVQAGGA